MAVLDNEAPSRAMLGQNQRRESLGQKAKSRTGIPLLLLLYVVALFTPMVFSVGPLLMNPLRLLLLCVTPILFFQLLAGRFGRLNMVDVLLMFYILWRTIALAINNPSMVVELVGSTTLEFFGGYLVARACIRDLATFFAFCRIFSMLIVVTLFLALYEQVTGDALLMMVFDALPGVRSLGDASTTRWGMERVQVAFAHPILYGLICSTAIPLTFMALKEEMPDNKRYLRTGMVSMATMMSFSSGAVLAMVAHYFIIGWNWLFRNMQRRWLLLFGIFLSIYISIDLFTTRKPLQFFLSHATFSAHTAFHRLIIFEWGMVNVWANPIFGLGLNDWVRPPRVGGSVDNFWLLTAMRYGIPGFVLIFGAYMLLLFRVGLKDLGTKNARLLRCRTAWCFTMSGLAFTLATVHVWSGPFSFVALLIGAGVWFLYVDPAEIDEKETTSEEADDVERPSVRYSRFS